MGHIEASRAYEAPADVVWDVVVDPTVYETVAPNLAEVALVSSPGPDMVRRCVDANGNSWTEACIRWVAGREFMVAVDVETSDFHRRWFSRFEGTWTCEARPDDVLVTIAFDFETRYGPVGWLVSMALARKAPSILEAIFDGWEREIESRRSEPVGQEPTAIGAGDVVSTG